MKRALTFKFAALAATLVSAAPARAIVGANEDGAAFADRVVMVLTRGPEGSGFCTGVVLTPRIILTAAHCVRARENMLVHYRDADGTPEVVQVEAATRNPAFRADAALRRTRSLDVGLVETETPLPERFRAAKLAEGDPPALGDAARAVGFGIAREGEAKSGGTLRAAKLVVREPASKILLWLQPTAENSASGACSGDSGGPVYDAGGETVVAVVAWTEGEKGRKCGALTQAILVAPLRAWIDAWLQRWRP